jgi:hypothetical protein
MATKTAEIDWPQELERLAREAEREALAKADEIFAEAAEEHQRQTDGYRFECRRWGDYLTVFIERAANRKGSWGNEPELKASTSLNIGQTKEIRLALGHCFDRLGTLEYRASHVADDRSSWGGWGTGYGRCAPGKGYHYEVSPDYPTVPSSRDMIRADAKEQERFHGHYMSMEDYQPRLKTEGYPRPAKDDKIRFDGIGITIYAPAGKGQSVYDAIMAELEKGYERPRDSGSHSENRDTK